MTEDMHSSNNELPAALRASEARGCVVCGATAPCMVMFTSGPVWICSDACEARYGQRSNEARKCPRSEPALPDIDRIRGALGLDMMHDVNDVVGEINDGRLMLRGIAKMLGCDECGGEGSSLVSDTECVRQLVAQRRESARPKCESCECHEASKWCGDCIREDYEACAGIDMATVAALRKVAEIAHAAVEAQIADSPARLIDTLDELNEALAALSSSNSPEIPDGSTRSGSEAGRG